MDAAHYASVYGHVYGRDAAYGAGHGQGAVRAVAGWVASGGGTVVDCGCGRNQFGAAVLERAPRATVYGVDVVRVDPVPAGVRFVAAPMWDLSGVPDDPNVITCFDALEHLYPEDVDRTLAEWRGRLAPGGRVVVTVCDRPSEVLGPGGVNLHPTVKPRAWWRRQIAETFGRDVADDGRHLTC